MNALPAITHPKVCREACAICGASLFKETCRPSSKNDYLTCPASDCSFELAFNKENGKCDGYSLDIPNTKYRISYRPHWDYIDLDPDKYVADWIWIPYFDVFKYSWETVANKIKTYLLFS